MYQANKDRIAEVVSLQDKLASQASAAEKRLEDTIEEKDPWPSGSVLALLAYVTAGGGAYVGQRPHAPRGGFTREAERAKRSHNPNLPPAARTV